MQIFPLLWVYCLMFYMQTRDSMRLMHSVGQVLSVMRYEEIMQYLTSLLAPFMQELQDLVTQEVSYRA